MRPAVLHLTITLLLLGGSLAVYGIWYGTISAKSASVAGLESQIATKTETAARVASARAALAEIAGDEATVRGYFVSDAGVVAFIDDLEHRGAAQGATVRVLSVANTPDAARPSLSVALGVSGPFDAVMRTLGSIEYAPYALMFSGVSLTLDARGLWHADVSVLVGSAPSAVPTGATRPT